MHQSWFIRFLPAAPTTRPREWWRAALGAGLALGLLVPACVQLFGVEVAVHMLAPLGASSVLVFAATSSPLAQPWPLLGGNLLGALCGLVAAQLLPTPLAAALAVLATIAAGFALRCLHPPACAVALTAVLGGPEIAALGAGFVWPVLFASALLLLVALAWNNGTGHAYPRAPAVPPNPHATRDPVPAARTGFSARDLATALADFGEFVDVRSDDLAVILRKAETLALKRDAGEVTAASIMSRDLVTGTPHMPLLDAWALLQQHRLRALPVTTADGRLVGVATLQDFLRNFTPSPGQSGLPVRLECGHGDALRDIMVVPSPQVRADAHIGELIPLLSGGGVRYLPVVDADGHLLGLISQTDMIAALFTCWVRSRG